MTILRTGGKLLLAGGKFLTLNSAPPNVGSTQGLAADHAFNVSNSLARFVIQRKAGTYNDADAGSADVYVPFTFTGDAPGTVQAQVLDFSNGAVVKEWTPLTNLVIDSATSGYGKLPNVQSGCDYRLQVRAMNNPTSVSTGTQKWGVGPCLLIVGQSNALSTLYTANYNQPVPGSTKNESTYWTDPEFTGALFGTDGFVANWTSGGTGSGTLAPIGGPDSSAAGITAFCRIVGANLKAKYGRKIPVCVIVWAFGSTSLGEMTPPGNVKTVVYTNTGTTSNNIGLMSPPNYGPGDFEGILHHEGETASGGLRTSRVTDLRAFYQAMLNVVAPHRTANDLFFRPAVLGSYTNGVYAIENMRGAVYDLEVYAQNNGWPRVKAGWTCIDLDPADNGDQGLHFRDVSGGNQYQKWSLRRMIQTTLKELGCATFTGMGPKISGVTRSGNVVTVSVVHERAGATLTARNPANPLTGWYAHTDKDFDDVKGHVVAVSGATITGANTVNVTVAEFPCFLKYMGGYPGTTQSNHPDLTNPVYDDTAYPTGATGTDVFTGLAVQPTPDSWKVI